MASVSVIIPVWNRARHVVRAISSVLYQTWTDFELIVVDDGSTDGTREALARFRNHLTTIEHSENRGVSAARNTGIESSSAPLIAFLDSDDYWLPEKLALQVAFFEGHPQAKICQTEEIWMRGNRRVNPKKKHLKPSGDIFVPSLKFCLVSPSAVMLKRSLLKEIGLFDESLPVCEDYDLWLRIAARYPIYLIKKRLLVKDGGRPDQLSSRYTGMDQFRIRALLQLIESGLLSEKQLRATLKELSRKCRIYGQGCLRRGKTHEGESYLLLPWHIKGQISSSPTRW